jgi:hypothetical protein
MSAMIAEMTLTPVEAPEEIKEKEESFEPVYLESDKLTFRNENDRLSLTLADGTYYSRVTLRRCFPFSTTDVFVTVMTPSTELERSHEIGIVTGIDTMDATSREALNEELKLHYFVPHIQAIFKIKEEYGFQYWTALTDRGEKEFILRDNIVSSARQIGPNRWLLIDINQARYEINDDCTLDKHSQKLMAKYLLL